MKLIVDGYNLLKSIQDLDYISEQCRQDFLKLIQRYAQAKHLAITVVFDGGSNYLPESEDYGNFNVIYAGHLSSADEVICEETVRQRGQSLIVVTSDRELGDFVLRQGADILKVAEFYARLKKFELNLNESEIKLTSLHKTSAKQDDLLDELMQQWSEIDFKVEEPKSMNRKPSTRKLPKNERRKRQKLKKL